MQKVSFLFITFWLFFLSIYIINAQEKKITIKNSQEYIIQDYLIEFESKEIPQNIPLVSIPKEAKSKWVKLNISNQTQETKNWVFHVGDYFINFSEVYWQDTQGEWQFERSGLYLPFSKKSIKNSQANLINLQIKAKQSQAFYIRISNIDQKPLIFNARLLPKNQWKESIAERNFIQGLFSGVVGIMIGYNLLIFLFSRDKPYIFYTLYMLANFIYFFNFYGFVNDFFLGEFPKLYVDFYLLGTGMLSIFYLLFIKFYLGTQKTLPKLDKQLKTWLFIRSFEIIIAWIWFKVTFDYAHLHSFHRIFGIIESFVFLFFLIKLARANTKIVYYLWIGTFFLYFGQAWSIVTGNNYVFQGGVVAEILIFSLGLGYRMRQNEESKREAQSQLIKQLEENKQLQQQINQELEEKVEQRTSEIVAQIDLIQEQKEKFESLSKTKDSLLSVLSHDVRSPLNSIKSVLNLMNRNYLEPEEVIDYTEQLSQRIEKTDKLLEEITSWAKLQRNELKVDLHPVKPYKITEEVRLLMRDTQNKNIKFQNHLPKDIKVYADAEILKIIMRNLISNAYKFTPNQGVINVLGQEEENLFKIVIQDNGIGIKPEKQNQLLEEVKIKKSRGTNNEVGTGLGLLLCKDFLERMGSSIKFESTLGKGTTFFFYLKKVVK